MKNRGTHRYKRRRKWPWGCRKQFQRRYSSYRTLTRCASKLLFWPCLPSFIARCLSPYPPHRPPVPTKFVQCVLHQLYSEGGPNSSRWHERKGVIPSSASKLNSGQPFLNQDEYLTPFIATIYLESKDSAPLAYTPYVILRAEDHHTDFLC